MSAATAATAAVSALRNSENSALAGAPSFYTGSGRDEAAPKLKGKKKGRAALITILVLLFGGGAFLGSSNSLLAPAIEALFTEATDTQYASASLRSARLMKFNLTGGATTTTWTGAKKYTAMSSTFKKRLAAHGIEVNGYGKNRTLTYTSGIEGSSPIEVTAANFDKLYLEDAGFRDAYTSSKRGRIANFFDGIADKIYKKLGISRNVFSQYKQTGDSNTDVAQYKETLTDKFNGNDTDVRGVQAAEYEKEVDTGEVDADGKPIKETVRDWDTADNTSSAKNSSTNTPAVAESKAQDMLESVSGTLSKAVRWGCGIMQIGNAISLIVAANEVYQSINYFMGLTENISKMKAGQGDSSAVNEVLNFMSTPATVDVPDLASVQATSTSDHLAANKTAVSGTPLEANGMQMILAGAPQSSSTNSLYSLERSGNAVVRILKSFGVTAAACNVAQIGVSALSIAVSLTPAGWAKIGVNIVQKFALGVGVSIAAAAFLGFLIPTMAQALFTNVFDNAAGKPAGELFARGASAANTRLGRNGSGQSLSSKEVAIAYNQTTQTVIALDATIDRQNLSPFDITNKNTFFGSIAYSLLPLATSSTSTTLATFLRTAKRATASIISPVQASGENSTYMTTFGECNDLSSIGAEGDTYCNPVTSTDPTTIDLSPDDATYLDTIKKVVTCDPDGNNCKVEEKSNLAYYVAYCANRESPFGRIDQNILSELNPVGGGAFAGILNNIPIVGDLLDIIGSASNLANEEWATGAKCVATTNPSHGNYTFWQQEGKYYQRYVEDMRLLEQMGAFAADADDGSNTASINPITAYEEVYEAAHPTDNSYAGYLARISGLTKETVEIALAFIEYAEFINDYDPTTRIAHTEPLLSEQSGTEVSSTITHSILHINHTQTADDASAPILAHHVIYYDIRNRSTTTA